MIEMHKIFTKISHADSHKIHEIALQALTHRPYMDMLEVELSLSTCHAAGQPLNLDAMLLADEYNLLHDIYGILRHIDMDTGQLGGCFMPRFAAREEQAK